jgi:catechol 2,3-dioxygenase-like lactoylglutathione lyase family enzyme
MVRSADVMQLAQVTLVVRDYDEAITFYVDAVGFELAADVDLGGGIRWVVVRPPGGAAGLLLAQANDDTQRSRIGDQTGGRVGFFLHTDDFASTHTRMQAAGVSFLETPRAEPYGTVAVFEDPYGNKWDLIQPAGH